MSTIAAAWWTFWFVVVLVTRDGYATMPLALSALPVAAVLLGVGLAPTLIWTAMTRRAQRRVLVVAAVLLALCVLELAILTQVPTHAC